MPAWSRARVDRPSGDIILESMAPVPAEGIGVMSQMAAIAGRHLRYAWEHQITNS
jgi:hypothetical protein